MELESSLSMKKQAKEELRGCPTFHTEEDRMHYGQIEGTQPKKSAKDVEISPQSLNVADH